MASLTKDTRYYIMPSEVELRSGFVEVGLDDSKVIVCKASVTSCCKFSGNVFISLGYSSKLIPKTKKKLKLYYHEILSNK